MVRSSSSKSLQNTFGHPSRHPSLYYTCRSTTPSNSNKIDVSNKVMLSYIFFCTLYITYFFNSVFTCFFVYKYVHLLHTHTHISPTYTPILHLHQLCFWHASFCLSLSLSFLTLSYYLVMILLFYRIFWCCLLFFSWKPHFFFLVYYYVPYYFLLLSIDF